MSDFTMDVAVIWTNGVLVSRIIFLVKWNGQ